MTKHSHLLHVKTAILCPLCNQWQRHYAKGICRNCYNRKRMMEKAKNDIHR